MSRLAYISFVLPLLFWLLVGDNLSRLLLLFEALPTVLLLLRSRVEPSRDILTETGGLFSEAASNGVEFIAERAAAAVAAAAAAFEVFSARAALRGLLLSAVGEDDWDGGDLDPLRA